MENDKNVMTMLERIFSRVEGIASRLDGLERKVEEGQAKLEQRLEKLEQRFEKLEQRLDNLEQLVTATKENVALLETEQSQRIGVLFDAYISLREMMKKALESFESVRPKINTHDIDIMNVYIELEKMKLRVDQLSKGFARELNSA